MIQTIADLQKATRSEINKAKKSISFKKHVVAQFKKDGETPGMTYEEWEKASAARKPEPCGTCHGKGEYIRPMRSVGTIHASSAHTCVARLYHDVVGDIRPQNDISYELRITFEIGHAIHGAIQAALHRAMGPDFQDEVRVDLTEALISNGHADGVGRFALARALLEIKTISEADFAKIRGPKTEHITQAAGLYAKALDAPFISFLYVSKGWPHNIKEYLLEYDEAVFDKWYREKGKKVEEALDEGRPPIAKATEYECKNCPYRLGCQQVIGFRDRFAR